MIDEPVDPRDRLSRELQRVRDRLGTLGLPRLAAVADEVYVAANAVTAAALRLEGRPITALPRLGDEVVSAQLSVAVHDLLAAARSADEIVLTECADIVTGLRRSLP